VGRNGRSIAAMTTDVFSMTLAEFFATYSVGQVIIMWLVGNLIASFFIGFGRGLYRVWRERKV
jgi:hypothetical protein